MCSICSLHLNAVLKKCLVAIRTIVQQYQVVCILYNVLINFWLCYVIKFTWRIQQRWKTFDATVSPRGFCPFLTILTKLHSWQIVDGQNFLNQLIQIYEATEWEREREETWSLFVSLILSKLDWGHHTINEPAVGKYKIGRLVSSTYFWSF